MQQTLHAFVELGNHLGLACKHFGIVKRNVGGDDTEGAALITGVVQVLCGLQQSLSGDAALVEANPADFLLLNHRDLEPKLCAANSGGVAPRPAADNYNVICIFCHSHFLSRASACLRAVLAPLAINRV